MANVVVKALQQYAQASGVSTQPASITAAERLASLAPVVPTGFTGAIYNSTNRLASGATYDLNGNMTSLTDQCGTTTYTWDARNRLIAVDGYNPDCTAHAESYSYDALGRRTSKLVGSVTTSYLYDGWDIVQELRDDQVRWNYVRSLNIDEPLARIGFDNTTEYYHADYLGSITTITDADGNVKTQYTYSPFGESAMSGTASDNPFQYTARENDGTGTYYYHYRYYNSALGRFISEDPIRLRGGVNYYSYVHNQPLLFRDALGLMDMAETWTQIGENGMPQVVDTYAYNGPMSDQTKMFAGAVLAMPVVALVGNEALIAAMMNPLADVAIAEFLSSYMPGPPYPSKAGYAGSFVVFLKGKYNELTSQCSK